MPDLQAGEAWPRELTGPAKKSWHPERGTLDCGSRLILISSDEVSLDTMEAWFERRLDALEDISEFSSRFGQMHGLSDEVLFSVQLAIEEVFTNMLKYEPATHSDVRIVLTATASDVIVTMNGYDVDQFDITQAPTAEFDYLAKTKSTGGRGIALIRCLMDSLHYEYANRVSTLTMRKAVG